MPIRFHLRAFKPVGAVVRPDLEKIYCATSTAAAAVVGIGIGIGIGIVGVLRTVASGSLRHLVSLTPPGSLRAMLVPIGLRRASPCFCSLRSPRRIGPDLSYLLAHVARSLSGSSGSCQLDTRRQIGF